MKNIAQARYTKLALGILLASLMPGCESLFYCHYHPEDESCQPPKASGVNVQNCGTDDVSTVVNNYTGRQWRIWAAKGETVNAENTVWLEANPNLISPLTYASPAPVPACGSNDTGNVATFDFNALGVAEGDIVTVRAIRIATGLADDNYKGPHCVEWNSAMGVCARLCDAQFNPGACWPTGTTPGNPVPDSIDTQYIFAPSRGFKAQTVKD